MCEGACAFVCVGDGSDSKPIFQCFLRKRNGRLLRICYRNLENAMLNETIILLCLCKIHIYKSVEAEGKS